MTRYRSVSIPAVLAAFLLTALGAGHDVQAAKRKRHHKGRAPSSGTKASAPEPDESPSGGESEAGEAPEPAAAKPKPAPEPEEAPPPAETDSGGGKRKKAKIKMEGETSSEASEPTAPSALPWLDISVGIAAFNRNLTYHQDADPVGNQLSPYSLPLWPVGVFKLVAYPLDPLVGGVAGDIGVDVDVMQGFGVSSKFNNSSSGFSSTVHDYAGGLRIRVPFGAANDLFLSGRFGEDAFTFNGPSRSSLLTPDTIYHYARGGFGLQLALGPSMSLTAGAGYRYITNKAGLQIQQFFPRLTVAGADAEVALTYAFSDIYALRAGIDWRRYWFDFHVKQGDNFIVGGAVDQSFLFSVSLVLTLGGSSGEHAEAEAAPAKGKGAKSDNTEEADKPKSDDGGGGSDEGGGGRKPPSGGDDL